MICKATEINFVLLKYTKKTFFNFVITLQDSLYNEIIYIYIYIYAYIYIYIYIYIYNMYISLLDFLPAISL